jgi:uncharacterized protein YlxW (UPF0749 family)
MLKKDLEQLVNSQRAEIARLNATIKDLESKIQHQSKPRPNLMEAAKLMAKKYKSVTKVQGGQIFYFATSTRTWELAL